MVHSLFEVLGYPKQFSELFPRILFFFFYFGFLSHTFTIHRTAGEGEAISLTPLYYFHPLHRNVGISQVITAECVPLLITSSRTRTGNLWLRAQNSLILNWNEKVQVYLDCTLMLERKHRWSSNIICLQLVSFICCFKQYLLMVKYELHFLHKLVWLWVLLFCFDRS